MFTSYLELCGWFAIDLIYCMGSRKLNELVADVVIFSTNRKGVRRSDHGEAELLIESNFFLLILKLSSKCVLI